MYVLQKVTQATASADVALLYASTARATLSQYENIRDALPTQTHVNQVML